jgi:FkbM family methyltransferase
MFYVALSPFPCPTTRCLIFYRPVEITIMRNQMRAKIVHSIKLVFPTLWLGIGLKFMKKHFEPELYLVPLLCNKNQIAIDVGANQGVYTYYMAKFAKQVVAFEPNVDLLATLKRVADKNVELQSAALSDVQGDSIMRVDPANHGLSTIEQRNNFDVVNPEIHAVERNVSTRTLDSFDFEDVSLIKIDVEGHEESVLHGARETIIRNRPVLIIETEDQHNRGAPRRITQMLGELGYRAFFVRDRGLHELAELKDSETDPRNYHKKIRYVNNFIFVPTADKQKITALKVAARCL